MRHSAFFRWVCIVLSCVSGIAISLLVPGAEAFPQPVTARQSDIHTQYNPLITFNRTSLQLDEEYLEQLDEHYNSQTRAVVYQLTSGLRPGRGETIPPAQSIHALPVSDVSFYNFRGYLLSGWFALNTPQAPVIILTHGTPGNRVSMVSRAAFLYKHGYNVLLFDFQSYGRSQGVLSTLGMVESEDILAAIMYLKTRSDTSSSKIGVLGLSMGATAAVLAAAHSSAILALVAESCPVDATRVPGDVPNEAAREADQALVEQIYGVDITRARPIDAIGKFAGRTAVFLINGDADTITPLNGMHALYQNAGSPRQNWVVPGAGHAGAFDMDTAGYEARAEAFFDAYL